jgi:FkbM family methyltransferase
MPTFNFGLNSLHTLYLLMASIVAIVLLFFNDLDNWIILTSIFGLYLIQGIFSFRKNGISIADILTLIRAISASILLAGPSELLFPALILIPVTDFFDGKIARKFGSKDHGALLDEETDAMFTLFAFLALSRLLDLPAWVLLAGVIRYPLKLLYTSSTNSISFPQWFSWTAKTISAAATVILCSAFLFDIPIAIHGISILLFFSFFIEAAIRFRKSASFGFLWSWLIYYGIPGRKKKMKQFYSQFIPENGLCFDLGSHLGNRIPALSQKNARVIAVEPAPKFAQFIRKKYRNQPNLSVVEAAVSTEEGEIKLHFHPAHPTLASVSESWIEEAQEAPAFKGIDWPEEITVKTCTLNTLRSEFGDPDFIKIDIEGHELQVISSMTWAPRCLSFEYLPSAKTSVHSCMRALADLGTYTFNISIRENMEWHFPSWVHEKAILEFIDNLQEHDASGDIYARRMD